MFNQIINSMCLEVGPRLCARAGGMDVRGSPKGQAEAFGLAIFEHTNAICVELAESAPSGGERSEFVIHNFRQKYHFVAIPFTHRHISR